ncbi:MAG: hypothetical protein L6R42_007492, partial [Xanthoria sp. 1 TBL-2021]
MAFMVKNPGLMPGMDTLKSGDIGKRRKGMYEIVQGCWRSCIEIGDGTGAVASDDHLDRFNSLEDHARSGSGSSSTPSNRPFVADAIIANPPSFAGMHCAEKLGIPLHLMFTMPWSPTQAFPHPLANIQTSDADQSITNFMSYALVEMMTWQGLGDVINRFREKSLGLEPLVSFLEAGPPPVYVGFGSIVVEDPNAMTRMIFDAVKQSGQRALVSKGWGGLGADSLDIPHNVFMLGNVPHDWLFKRVSCVVHHGGAGTTAAGIAAGKPTVVVPFFGDQPFWGSMVAKAGAGPWPTPYKQLTSDKLAASILEALEPEVLHRAAKLGQSISHEQGTKSGAKDFQTKLDVDALRCSVAPSQAAAWRVKRTNIRLSPFAATLLAKEGLLDFGNLKLYRPREYDTEDGPWDPITGATSAIMGTMGSMMMGFADLPVEFLRALHIKPSEKPSTETRSEAAAHCTKKESLGPSDVEDLHISPPSSQTSIENDSTTNSVRKSPSSSTHHGTSPHPSLSQRSTRGFHNAPRLYGDESVRHPDKVTGFQSGLRTAGKEFGYGVYDGVTGLFTQPIEGAKQEGVAGFVKGFGKGIGGFFLKPSA